MFLNIFLLILGCASGSKSSSSTNINKIPIKSLVIDFEQVDKNDNKLTFQVEDEIFDNKSPIVVKTSTSLINIQDEVEILEAKTISGTVSVQDKDISYTPGENRSDILTIKYLEQNQEKTEIREVRIRDRSKTCLAVYIAGDNNLNGSDKLGVHRSDLDFVWLDLQEMTQVSFDSSQLSIIVFLDLHSDSEEYYSNTIFSQSGVYLIENGEVERVRNILYEPNTGKREQLEYFLKCVQSFSNYEKIVLDLWGHGLSIFGVCFDDNIGTDEEVDGFIASDGLTPLELKQALDNCDMNISVILFSACLMMDLGVLWQLKDRVKAVSGSADYVPGKGSFYGNTTFPGIVGYLSNLPDNTDDKDIAIEISKINYNSFITEGAQLLRGDVELFLTQSAVDQTKIVEVRDALKSLLNYNINFEFKYQLTDKVSHDNTLFYYQKDYSNPQSTIMVDAVSLSKFLSQNATSSEIRNKAKNLYEKLDQYVIYRKHIKNHEDIGVSLLFTRYDKRFSVEVIDLISENEFYKITKWDQLIK
ncbi:MAG TPA: hypothetical protein DEP20_00260 [Fusobacteria bacterium]|nr:hypothetical protein [Fusobacteriota bacterium]|tara:strand:+ start:1568 stop:3157 length:1590 start_codon:yes stop_codon:yes gene_type:complete